MNDFLTQQEIAEIKIAHEEIIVSVESPRISITYRTPASVTGTDPVYGNVTGTVNPTPVMVTNVPAIIKHVGPDNKDLIDLGFIKAGDAIFYFSTSLDLSEPESGSAVIEGTLLFIAPDSVEWHPDLENFRTLNQTLGFWLGGSEDNRIGQVVLCKLQHA